MSNSDMKSISDILASAKAVSLTPGKTEKVKLTAKDAHVVAEFTQGTRVPVALFTLPESTDSFTFELISLGNMLGFKKTMLFPLIIAVDENGKEIFGESTGYETRSPEGNLPMHLAASWKFDNAANVKYIIVYPDMVSAKETNLQSGSNKGIVVNALLNKMRVKKDAYARLHVTVR